MKALHIRSLQAEDEAEWRRLWTLYLDYYESTVPEEVYTTKRAVVQKIVNESLNQTSQI